MLYCLCWMDGVGVGCLVVGKILFFFVVNVLNV